MPAKTAADVDEDSADFTGSDDADRLSTCKKRSVAEKKQDGGRFVDRAERSGIILVEPGDDRDPVGGAVRDGFLRLRKISAQKAADSQNPTSAVLLARGCGRLP